MIATANFYVHGAHKLRLSRCRRIYARVFVAYSGSRPDTEVIILLSGPFAASARPLVGTDVDIRHLPRSTECRRVLSCTAFACKYVPLASFCKIVLVRDRLLYVQCGENWLSRTSGQAHRPAHPLHNQGRHCDCSLSSGRRTQHRGSSNSRVSSSRFSGPGHTSAFAPRTGSWSP